MSQKRRICINIIGQTSDISTIYIEMSVCINVRNCHGTNKGLENGFDVAVSLNTLCPSDRTISALGVSLERSMQ